MLHEILLALSGYPSPIFDSTADGVPFLTPTEKSLLHRLDHIASLHRDIRAHCHTILDHHLSTVGRTVTEGIVDVHLRDFTDLILQIETQALTNDAARVGAHNIIPLASILNDFEPWTRRLEWLWDVVCFILPRDDGLEGATRVQGCHGSKLINRLKQDSRTGYPDLQSIALHLLALAEKAWIRQLMRWFLRPESVEATVDDLFLAPVKSKDGNAALKPTTLPENLPGFVSPDTASSVLFIGRIIRYLQAGRRSDPYSNVVEAHFSAMDLASQFGPIANLRSPLTVTSFSSGISAIRGSLSQKIVKGLLPIRQITRTVTLLHQFFLFGRKSFAENLIVEADKLLVARKARIKNTPLTLGGSLAGIMMKEGEVNSVLSRTFVSLSPYLGQDDAADPDLDWARDHLRMIITTNTPSKRKKEDISADSVRAYHDFLLSTPTRLDLPLEAPLDLFLSQSDLSIYAGIHSYVLSIQRGRTHLADLWRQTTARRIHPAPAGPPRSNKPGVMRKLQEARERSYERSKAMRSTWSTASIATYLLSELGNYLVSEVIGGSWETFSKWISIDSGVAHEGTHTPTAEHPNGAGSYEASSLAHSAARLSIQDDSHEKSSRDPEALSEAHRLYLRSMARSLLMAEDKYLSILHSLLKHVGHFVAVNLRLLHVQHNLDLQAEGVAYGGTHNFEEEEKEVYEEILGAGHAVQADMKLLTAELQRVDASRAERGPSDDAITASTTGFEPWKGYGIDRLLLRLDATHEDQGRAVS